MYLTFVSCHTNARSQRKVCITFDISITLHPYRYKYIVLYSMENHVSLEPYLEKKWSMVITMDSHQKWNASFIDTNGKWNVYQRKQHTHIHTHIWNGVEKWIVWHLKIHQFLMHRPMHVLYRIRFHHHVLLCSISTCVGLRTCEYSCCVKTCFLWEIHIKFIECEMCSVTQNGKCHMKSNVQHFYIRFRQKSCILL